MTDFIIKKLPYDLSNQAGLALIGKYLKRINFNSLVDPIFSVRSCSLQGQVLPFAPLRFFSQLDGKTQALISDLQENDEILPFAVCQCARYF